MCLNYTFVKNIMHQAIYKILLLNLTNYAYKYLSGGIHGETGRDIIHFGDLTITNQTIGIANEIQIPLLDEVVWDGIVGLAYPNHNMLRKKVLYTLPLSPSLLPPPSSLLPTSSLPPSSPLYAFFYFFAD